MNKIPFSVPEATRSGTFMSGMPGSGKSNGAKHLVKMLIEKGIRVFVFDPSEAWSREGPIDKVREIRRNFLDTDIPHDSRVFDIKTLYIPEQQTFVQKFCQKIFMEHLYMDVKDRIPTVLVFEEAQIYLPEGRLKSKVAQEIMRVLTLGRNYSLRVFVITQFAANVDKAAVKPCGQKYMGFTDEKNDKAYLGDWVKDKVMELENLEVGEFFYKFKKELKKLKFPLFKGDVKPVVEVSPVENVEANFSKPTWREVRAFYIGFILSAIITSTIAIFLYAIS